MANQSIYSGLQVDGATLAIGPNGVLANPVSISAPIVAANGTALTANYTMVSGDGGKNFQSVGATAYSVSPLSGVGNFQVSATPGSAAATVLGSPENLILYSEAFENTSGWTATAATVATGVTDPKGGTAARAVTTTSASNSLLQAVTSPFVTAKQYYTMSMWVQGVGSSIGTKVTLGNYNNSARQQQTFTLTSSWQQINVAILPPSLTAQNAYIIFAGTGATVPNGAVVNIYGAQVTKPSGKSYATTTATVVNGAYNVIGQAVTTAANPIISVVEGPTGTFTCIPAQNISPSQDITFQAFNRAPRRGATITLAAFNSPNSADADYVCTGVADDLAITAAINSLAYTGGKVFLRAGLYVLTSAINFDASYVTLEGEAMGFWQAYTLPYPTISIQGISSGTQLYQTTSGANGITINQVNIANNQLRHSGIVIKNFYMFSASGNGTAILDSNVTDISFLQNFTVHNFANGVNLNWDTGTITDFSIQSCTGTGITRGNVFGSISNGIIYDNGGQCIVLNRASGAGGGTQVSNVTMGSCCTSTANAIAITSNGNTISNCTINGVVTGNAIDISASTAFNNTIVGNAISINNAVGSGDVANNSGHGVYIHGSAVNNSVTGNALNQTTTGTNTGFAVALDSAATGNTIAGNVMTGTWNSGGTTKVQDSTTGDSNIFSGNSLTLNPGVVPTITLGAGAGTSPGTVTVTGDNKSGVISFATGTATTTGSTLFTLTYGRTFTIAAPNGLILQSANAAAAALATDLFTATPSTTAVVVTVGSSAAPVSTTLKWVYSIV